MSERFAPPKACGVALLDIDDEMPFDGRHCAMKPVTMTGG
jgi:hypothetical protein